MTWRELLGKGTAALRGAGIPDAEYDARELLFRASGLTMTTYALRSREEVPEGAAGEYPALIRRRAERIPLQRILGTASFYGREFAVRDGVLIPRFDTETLVEGLIPRLRPGMKLLDLCTGSGCILISLLLEGPEGMTGAGGDISPEAVAAASENAAKLGADAVFVQSDLFEKFGETYDLITANPPYIRSGEIDGLEPEVSGHEPRAALDGGGDGLEFYRRIVGEAPDHLNEGGLLGLEIGYDQAQDVSELMERNGFGSISVKRDLGWNTRAVIGTRK